MAAPFTRTLRRSLLQSPTYTTTTLPPAFLLPLRAHLSTITHTTSTSPQPQDYHPTSPPPPPTKLHQVPPFQKPHPSSTSPQPNLPKSSPSDITPSQSLLSQSTSPPTESKDGEIPPLLPMLAAQPPHYITAHIHARPYLLTAGDTLRLPFLMPRAPLGTILRLNRASMLGSRDFTLRGDEISGGSGSGKGGGRRRGYIDERFFVCRARVVGVETEPLRVVEKTKRRNRRVKRVKSKMRFTVLRVLGVEVRVPRREEGEDKAEAEDKAKGEEREV
ncbi:MAG: hypothetical protein Q9166_001771 [cf. Caloplaca sp. 2 TL-2023]